MNDFIENRISFIKRLKNESRNGLSENFLQFLVENYNSTEKYISEIEFENIRLATENRKLKKSNSFINGMLKNISEILLKRTHGKKIARKIKNNKFKNRKLNRDDRAYRINIRKRQG